MPGTFVTTLFAEALALLVASLPAGFVTLGRRGQVSIAAVFVVSCTTYLIVTHAFVDVVSVHITLAAACLALAGIGALCRAAFAHTLDRVAAGAVAGFTILFGIFLIGTIAAGLTPAAMNVLLLANPIVAVASAARIDIFHTPWLYEFSPIAHLDFRYPAWPLASAVYGCIAAVAFLAARVRTRRRASALSPLN